MNGMEQYGEFIVSNLEQTMHDGFMERIFSITDSKVYTEHVLQSIVIARGKDTSLQVIG